MRARVGACSKSGLRRCLRCRSCAIARVYLPRLRLHLKHRQRSDAEPASWASGVGVACKRFALPSLTHPCCHFDHRHYQQQREREHDRLLHQHLHLHLHRHLHSSKTRKQQWSVGGGSCGCAAAAAGAARAAAARAACVRGRSAPAAAPLAESGGGPSAHARRWIHLLRELREPHGRQAKTRRGDPGEDAR